MTRSVAVAALGLVGAYLVLLLYVGILARRARRSESMDDFYLAGRSLGPLVLFATLYATQYSGNSFLGYPGEAYRIGFAWVMSVGFMTAIIVCYLMIAPSLYRASRRLDLITPGDWLQHRFGSPSLTLTANLVSVVALANYLLAQLMAMGHVVAGFSGGAVPYWMGVVGLTVVILIYETLGGMRAVAWTDAVQGALMLVGLAGVLAAIIPSPDHLAAVTSWIATTAPDKVAVPAPSVSASWISTLILIGFSGAVYPQAIQRIYAARSTRALKRGIATMVCMPHLTMIPLFLIGIISLRELSTLEGIAADQVMPLMLARWTAASPWLLTAALAVVLAAIAAIMSTADSVLLTLSSMLAKDFLGATVLKRASDARLTQAGKLLSWAIVAALMVFALVPRITLWGLTELKMELLVQISPLFLLGLHWPRLRAGAGFAGLVAGLVISLGLPLSGYTRPFGLHDGTVGWMINLLLCVTLSRLAEARDARRVHPLRPTSGPPGRQ
jgi:SSS family solute:Na+ symporter/sodium/pantothenate symporter